MYIYVVNLAKTKRNIKSCEMDQKNEEEKIDLDANIVNNIIEYSICNISDIMYKEKRKKETNNNKSFE